MPHGHCYLWKPSLLSLHATSDFLIGTAYVLISFILYGLVKKINLSFSRVIVFFGVFIGACGLTHFMEVWTLWYPAYWESGFVKMITAIASVGTGVYLWKLRLPLIQLAESARAANKHKVDLEQMANNLKNQIEVKQEELTSIVNNIPQLAWKTDPNGYITWYNQRWYDYTGTTLEQMQGWGWKAVHHPDHTERVTKKWTEHLLTGENWEDTFPLKGKDGLFRWFLSRAHPIRDREGKILHWFGTNTDITEQKMEQQRRIEVERELQAALKTRDEFLLIASHELKTPLTSMLFQAQYQEQLIKKGNTDVLSREKVEENLQKTIRSVLRLNKLVDEMLDISRIRTGQFKIEPVRNNLSQVINEVLERVRNQKSADAAMKIIFQGPAELFATFDRNRIEQVIDNLLQNAFKYGQGKPITIILEESSNTVRVSVRDEGMGIPDGSQNKIFDKFERAMSAENISGFGIGLYICRRIIEAHQGKIWVESTLQKGSTFIFEIPK